MVMDAIRRYQTNKFTFCKIKQRRHTNRDNKGDGYCRHCESMIITEKVETGKQNPGGRPRKW